MYRPINDCIGRLMTLSADNPIGTDIPIFRKFDRYRIGRLSADYRLPISDRYGICAYTRNVPSKTWIAGRCCPTSESLGRPPDPRGPGVHAEPPAQPAPADPEHQGCQLYI